MFGDPLTNPKQLSIRKVEDVVAKFEGGKNIQAGDCEASNLRILKVSAVTSGTYVESECKPAPTTTCRQHSISCVWVTCCFRAPIQASWSAQQPWLNTPTVAPCCQTSCGALYGKRKSSPPTCGRCFNRKLYASNSATQQVGIWHKRLHAQHLADQVVRARFANCQA